MRLPQLLVTAATLVALFTPPPAEAAPVRVAYEGLVTDYMAFGGPVDSVMPLGASVTLDVIFDHTFAGGTFPFDTDFGPASGTLTLAGVEHTLTAVSLYSYSYSATPPFLLHTVQLRFNSDGPDLDGANYWGFTLVFAPDLSSAWSGRVGFLFDSGWYSYANLSTEHYAVTPLSEVPVPATMPLALTALLATALLRRRPTGLAA